MVKTKKGATPTLTFTFKEYDPTIPQKVVLTFARKDNGKVLLEIWEDDLEITEHTIKCFLTQEQTLSFPKGEISVQFNFVYADGKRIPSEETYITFDRNLHDEVILA